MTSWERRLWNGRRYLLTDLRITSTEHGVTRELALDDIGDVHRSQSGWQRVFGLSTIEVCPRDGRSNTRRVAQRPPRQPSSPRSSSCWPPTRTPA